MDFDDIDISYIGEEEAIDDTYKKVRGKDLYWTKKINFNNGKQYKDSNVVEDLEENYTLKRK